MNPIKVRIKNFQSISDLEFEIQGFTCVTGLTNIGKSAIIRAISGALLGSPVVGDVRKGEKFCTVELNGKDISLKWEKGERGINRYWIPADNPTPLDKVGQGQIPEISKMGFGSIKIGSDSIQPWLATQFDPVFLMNKSGPAVTDFLSEVSRLGILQDAITINVRGVKRARDSAKLQGKIASDLKIEEDDFKNIDHLISAKKDLDDEMTSIQQYVAKVISMDALLSNIELEAEILRVVHQSKNVIIPEDTIKLKIADITIMSQFWSQMSSEAKVWACLEGVLKIPIPESVNSNDILRLSSAEVISRSINDETLLLEEISKGVYIPEVEEIPGVFNVISQLRKQISEENQSIMQNKKELSNLDTELSTVQVGIDEIPVCPTCKRAISVSQ